MSSVCSSLFCYALTVLITICVGILTYLKWNHSYWKRKNVPHLKPISWYGTMENPFSREKTLGVWLKKNYDEFKKMGVKHGGIYNFGSPAYFAVDPDFVKDIMQNDFQYFVDRGFYHNEIADPLSASLFFLDGQKWRNQRVKVTPAFTSGKMKMMFDTLVTCSYPLKNAMDDLTEEKQQIDVKELIACYTTDVIGSCVFGLECNSFRNPEAEFRQRGKELFNSTMMHAVLQLICMTNPSIGHYFNIRVFPKSATDFLHKVVQDTINYRIENNVQRKDMLQMLTEVKTNNNNGSSMTIKEIAAQCLAFFAAGFETSSSTMSYGLYELAKDQDIQKKVRDEINSVLSKYDHKITYDAMMDLKYMTQVLEETMRKYPSLPNVTRKCNKDYPVPNTNVVIEKGMCVFISILGLHYDPDYYPNPEKFEPERFSEENKKGRHQFAYIPFGEGPRMCIGMRFGMLQMKVCLTVLLKNYIFSWNQRTPKTLTYNPRNFLLECNETILLNSTPVQKS